jgi:phenylpropionate dioxygenase-like ring-hydroxylating dioxygenase large terminal subunit
MAAYYKTAETLKPGAQTLAGKYYVSSDIFDQEQGSIFSQSWLCMGRTSEIAQPGEYIVRQVGQESILLVRDQLEEIQALYNVCRHRGSRLCMQDSGKFGASIQCPYHAWTYNLRGELIGAPLMDEVDDFRKQEHHLHSIHTAQWEGFIFINLSDDPEPFEQAFNPLIDKFSAWNLPHLLSLRRIDYQVKANWKLIVQNYSECYHCPLIHPDLVRRTPYRSGQNDLFEGPYLGGFMELYDGVESMTMSSRICALPVGAFTDEQRSRIDYYAIFPTLLLSLHLDYVMFHTLWPLASGETRITCEWLFAPNAADSPDFDPDDAVAFWDMTNHQDWRACEMTQLGVSSRSYSPAPYSSAESLLAAFDEEYLKRLSTALREHL